MKQDKTTKSQIRWCLHKRRGITLEEPNNNLCQAYLKKAHSALNMLKAAQENQEPEWIATTAYYARYFALYALLQECGIKSEIHDCTIALLEYLFIEEKLIPKIYHTELEEAKQFRIDTQYYVTEAIDTKRLNDNATKTQHFILQIEEAIDKITAKQITKLRDKLQKQKK
ncbi:MAG: HEPN domain-containing protein [Candidatus Nanoarchaeia archaeon]